MQSANHRNFLWLGIAVACLAFGLSLLSGDAKVALHTTGRLHPWLHFGAFFVLGILSVLSSDKNRMRLILLVCAILLGLSIEITEKIRFAINLEILDVVNDTAGVILGALTGWMLARKDR